MKLLFNVIKAINQVDDFPFEIALEPEDYLKETTNDEGGNGLRKAETKTKKGNGNGNNSFGVNISSQVSAGDNTDADYDLKMKRRKEIIAQSQVEAKSIIERAIKKGEEAKEKGYKEGYEKGKLEGHKKGVEQGLKEAESWISKGIAVYEEMEKASQIWEKENHEVMIKIALEISRRLLRKEVLNDEQVIVRTIMDALSNVDRPKQVLIRVNPQELAVIDGSMPEIKPLLSGVSHFKVEPDPSIDIGGCIIDTDQGAIDAQVESQIKIIEKALTDHMAGVLFDGS